MKKNKFILGVVACAFAALAMTGCSLTLENSDDRAVTSGYKLTSISLDTTKVTTTFIKGAKFSYDGLVVNGTYADNSTKVIEDYSVSTPNMNKCEEQTVTVTAADNATATYKITVSLPVESIAINAGTYEVTATYADKTEKTIPGADIEWSVDSTKENIVATYLGKTATVAVPEGANIRKAYDAGISAKAMHDAGISYEALLNGGLSITDLITDCKDYEIGTSDLSQSWKPGTDYIVNSSEEKTLYFVNYGTPGENWNNFLVEVLGTSGITLRCDNYGWDYDGTAGVGNAGRDIAYADTVPTTTVTDWASHTAKLSAGSLVKLIVSHDGEKVTVTATSRDIEGWEQKYVITCKTDSSKASVTFHLNIDKAYLVVLKDAE